MELRSAGTPIIETLILTTCLGDKIDITNQFLTLNLYEDIFSPVLTGSITLADNLDMFGKFPVSGNEKLTIKFYSWDYSPQNRKCDFIHRTFDILKITDISSKNDYTKYYTLHFASPEFKKNETIRVSKAYRNTTISNVIASLLTEDYEVDQPLGLGFSTDALTESVIRSPFITAIETEAQYQKIDDDDSIEFFVEKTKYTEPFITLPFMKPFDIIKVLSSRSIRSAGGRYGTIENSEAANFLFFENKRGFQFVSLETLLENKPNPNLNQNITKFVYSNSQQNQPYLDNQRNVLNDRFISVKIQNCFDVIENINAGMYSSKLQTYDIVTGQIFEKDYDFAKEFYKTESIERNDAQRDASVKTDWPQLFLEKDGTNPLTTKFLSKRLLLPLFPTRGVDNVTNETTQRINAVKDLVGPEEYVQKRLSQLSRINNFRLLAEVAGNSKHKVGDIVEVDLQDFIINDLDSKGAEASSVSSKYYSGNYLITQIHHVVTKTEYKMLIELVKDSSKAKIGEI